MAIPVENYGVQNKNNVMIHFMNMIKYGGFFRTDTLHLYIKAHTNNECGRTFKNLNLLYWKKNDFAFDECCENLNTSNNVEVIQNFHEYFFDLE